MNTPVHRNPAPSDRTPHARGGREEQRAERLGLSLRLRLMLMLLAAFGIVQVLLSVAHLLYVRRSADEVFFNELSTTADAMTRRVSSTSAPLTDALLSQIAGSEENGILWQECAASVYDKDGMLIASSLRPAIPLDAAGGLGGGMLSSTTTGRATLEGFPPDGEKTKSRIIARPFSDSGNRLRILLVAAPESFVSHISDRVNTSIVLLTPAGLLASAVAGWIIAGIAVRPLRQVGDIANQLGPDNLGQPIDFHSSASELKLLKEELDQMRHRLETGYEAQERFVANVSHEIKTPIATVLTEAQTLGRHDGAPPEIRQFIDSTQDEMRRLGKLVESFLMLTRVRHGKPLGATTRPVPANDLVLDAVQRCWRNADEHGVKLLPELAIEEETELSILGDPELLQTLVDNLIRNAIRFSPPGSKVRLLVRPDGTENVCVCVRDEGPGIPEAMIDKIFDRFAQGKSEEKLGRGSGLGLEIAQGIAELHRGRVTATNLPTGGCEFCVTLPLAATINHA